MPSAHSSYSAELAAFMRALAAREADETIRCEDDLARHFLGPALSDKYIRLVLAERVRPRGAPPREMPGSFYYHWARTRHFDALLLDAVAEGLDQLVILGAGYDTRAYRMKTRLSGVRIFELDLPATQRHKTTVLRRLFGAVPGHVTYVPLDLNALDLPRALGAHGYDTTAKTFFAWEGVSSYLQEAAVQEVFDFVARQAAAGSTLAFDYVLQSVLAGDLSPYGAAVTVPAAADAGEPLVFGIDPEALENLLAAHRLRLVGDYGARALEQHYLRREDGRVAGRVWACFRVAHAVVP